MLEESVILNPNFGKTRDTDLYFGQAVDLTLFNRPHLLLFSSQAVFGADSMQASEPALPKAPPPIPGSAAAKKEEEPDENSDYCLVEVVEVLYDFNAQTSTEITMSVGDQLVVTKKNDYGWWEGYNVDDSRSNFCPCLLAFIPVSIHSCSTPSFLLAFTTFVCLSNPIA